MDVHHAWLLEDLPGGRLRILTQETQIGKPAQELARTKPNPMLNALQEWIEGLARAGAQRAKSYTQQVYLVAERSDPQAIIVRYANPVMALNYTCLTEAYSRR